MDVHNEVPVLILHVLEADIPQDASIVDQNVNTSEVLDSSLNDLLAICYAVVVGYGFAAGSFDFIDDNIGSLCIGLAMLVSVFEGRICRRRAIAPGACIDKHTLVELPSPLNEPPRSFTTTLAPLDPKKVAYALPNPPPAPVTTTTWPS